MPIATYAGETVTVNDEGFFDHPDEWSEEMAPEIAVKQKTSNSPSSTGA